MEKLRPAELAPVAEAADAAVPAERDPRRLTQLIEQAIAENSESERARLCTEINALLTAMRAPGNETDEAKAVLKELDAGRLIGLLDQRGRSVRAEAVETLLACGFPHALSVKPDDLEHREAVLDQRRFTLGKRLALGSVMAVLLTLLFGTRHGSTETITIGIISFAIQVVTALTWRPDETREGKSGAGDDV